MGESNDPFPKNPKRKWVLEFAHIKRRNDKQTSSCNLSSSHTPPSSLVPTTSTIRTSAKKERKGVFESLWFRLSTATGRQASLSFVIPEKEKRNKTQPDFPPSEILRHFFLAYKDRRSIDRRSSLRILRNVICFEAFLGFCEGV